MINLGLRKRFSIQNVSSVTSAFKKHCKKDLKLLLNSFALNHLNQELHILTHHKRWNNTMHTIGNADTLSEVDFLLAN